MWGLARTALAMWWLGGASLAWAAAPVFGPAAPVNGYAATDTGNDSTPRIATDGHGTWISVWASTYDLGGTIGDDSDILASRSTDLGVSWTAPVPVNRLATTDEEFDFAPAIATDGHGLWIAAWVTTNGPDTDIFTARSTNNGATWTNAVPLFADAGSDTGNDDHPQIVSDGAGTWLVVWDSNGRYGNDRDVLYARSTNGGVTWSAPAALGNNASSDKGSDQRPQLASDGHGTWVAAWASNDTLGDTTGKDFDILFTRSTNGGVTWTAARPLNNNAFSDKGLDDRPQLATDGRGTWVAAWVSDESFGGSLGTDLDVLTVRSTDGGATWSLPAALNANAKTDSGEDGGPTLATDGHGTWVAVWESTDMTSGDHELVMAHSSDGANWSTPHLIDPGATTDGRRDIAPQLATDGNGVWNAVWTGSGGLYGADNDVMRTAGRERCGNGSVDPGEQCDDGNTRGGDACPATCEFPPPATPHATPGPGDPGDGATATAEDGATPTESDGTTPTPEDGATPTETPSPDPNATETASPDPNATATPTPEDGATPTKTPSPDPNATKTASPDPNATATPTPGGTGGPGSTATPTVVGSPDPNATATPEDGAPTPGVTPFGGGLESRAAAKAAVGCQRAVVKSGAQLVSARLTQLGACGRAIQRCIQTKPDDPTCVSKAATRCRSAFASLAATDRKQAAALRAKCGGTLPFGDVLRPAGLGFGWLACDANPTSLDDLVGCVVGEHGCRSAALFEVLQPRAKELMRLPGMNATTVDGLVCLRDHGGDGETVGDPAGQGKAVDACAAAIVKAGASFVKTRLGRLAKCADGLFTCVQLSPGDGACLAKARMRCDQATSTSASDERKLTSAVQKRCGESIVAYATLRAARAANLQALAEACAAVGVADLETLADYQQCLVRADVCRVEGVVRVQAPRLAELLAVVGRGFGSSFCGRE